MNLTVNLRERVRVNSIIRIKRSLEGLGSLSITQGQELKPHDILGKYRLSAGFVTIKLAKLLSASPEEGTNFLQRKIGEKIYKGELLALKQGLFGKKVVTAPTDGIIDEYIPETGELLLKYLPKEVSLTAGVIGIAEEVNKQIGEVVIKTVATEIFGVVGSGKGRSGILEIIDGKDHLTNEPQLNERMKGHIIVAGALIYKDALQRAIEFGISGIVSGGINADDFLSISGGIDPSTRLGTDVGISFLATEGFGAIPLGDDIFRLLTAYQGKFVFLTGNSSKLILPSLDPDIIILLKKVSLPPLSRTPERQPEVKTHELKLGSKVRVIWQPYMGSQGIVKQIDQTATSLSSGISTYLVTVETPQQKLRVPYPNIELI